jgi:hypothetical protein
MKQVVSGLFVSSCAFGVLSALAYAGSAVRQGSASSGLPVDFVENRGQWPEGARFVAHGARALVVVEGGGLALPALDESGSAVRLTFEGARADVRPAGIERRGRYNFYLGDDASKWREDVPAFGAVVYRSLYNGIDLLLREECGELEYELTLAPGADLARFAVRCEGVAELEVAADGALVLHTSAGTLRQTPPKTWEVLPSGEPKPIESRFRLLGPDRYGFEAPGRDPALGLVVDPGIEWSTFLGGSGSDYIGPAVPARDGSGDVFVGGSMNSPDFPGLTGSGFTGLVQSRAFIARLGGSGSTLVYATFLGGWHSNLVWRGLAVDSAGNAVLAGQTFSPDFPTTTGAFDSVCENKDAFVFRLSPTGALIFSTFLGGNAEDLATTVGYDPAGRIVVGGFTTSSDFPTTIDAFDPTYNAPNAPSQGGAHGDMFVSRLSPDGTQLTYSTFLGGPSLDFLEDLVIDPAGFVTVAGWVSGNSAQVFVSTPGAFDTTWNGSLDGAIARLELDGAGVADLKYATLIGGASDDELWSVALSPASPDLVTFAGHSWSNDYPTTAGVVRPTNPPVSQLFPQQEAGIVTRFRFPATGGGTHTWSTYHGAPRVVGEGHTSRITDVTVNAAGEPIVVGDEVPWDIPTTLGAFARVARGSGAVSGSFVTRLDANATQYLFQSFFGGSAGGASDNFDTVPQVAHVAGNTVLVSGQTTAYDFPVTPLALDTTTSGIVGGGASNEGFVMRVGLDPSSNGDLTAVPPPLVSPPDGATFHSGFVGRLEWSAVTDPSGIEAYEYQVAADPTFDKRFLAYRGGIRETEALIPPSNVFSGGLGLGTLYWRVRTVDGAGNLSAWSPTRSFTVSSTTGQPVSHFVQTHPTSVVGGAQATGMLHLSDPAPPGGLVARVAAYHDRPTGLDLTRGLPVPVTVPQLVNIPAGALSAPFTINTSAVSQPMGVSVVATVNGVGGQGAISVTPPSGRTPIDVVSRPSMVTGGNPATGTVTIDGPAPSGGIVVSLSSSHPTAASTPASVTVPAGARSASFPITTSPVSVEVDAKIQASSGGGSFTRDLHVRGPGLPTLTSMTIAPTSVAGGSNSGGTLTFSGPIPLGTWPAFQDARVEFSFSDPDAAGLFPGDDLVPAGATSHVFGLFTVGAPQTRSVTVNAHFDTVTLSGLLTVNAVTGVTVSSMTANVTSLKGGQGGIATVNLAAPAPATLRVALSASHPNLFSSLPSSVVISSGSTSAQFPFVTSTSVSATTAVTLTASYGASAANLGLSVSPPAAAIPPAVSLALSPMSVSGGSPSTGTVTLQSAAPAGGASVQLSSSNTSVAAVPATVTVPAGATSASFTVTTLGVSASTTVTIGALLHLSPSVALTVTAGSGPPPTPAAPQLLSPANGAKPAQPITFDWTDVPNAATYTIQIDDSNVFSSPLVVNESVSASQFTRGGFAVRRHWWRVRGVNSAGVAGPWSVVRRFDPQAGTAAPALSTVTVSPASVVGGSSSSGTATLTAAAPSGGALVTLTSSQTGVATVPASVTIPAGSTSATFAVATSVVTTSTTVTLSGTYAGATRSASLVVTSKPQLNGLSLSPASVVGGNSSQATVTLSAAAPAGGAVVSLSSSSGVATVPASVTIPSGSTSATFSMATQSVSTPTQVTVSGTYDGITRTATLTVNPTAGDVVAIPRVEYDTQKRELRVEATSTSSNATLQVFVTSTNALIGTLANVGGGRYESIFTWPTNPQSITVRSNLGGSATANVVVK